MCKLTENDNHGNAAGLQLAMELDRNFFQQHPTFEEYTRNIVPGEFAPEIIPRGRELQGRVTVRQVAPGFRVRFAPWRGATLLSERGS